MYSSSCAKQSMINRIHLPEEIINIVKEYVFYQIRKILQTDVRYKQLKTIPCKHYDSTDDSMFVYMPITDEKTYYMIYCGDTDTIEIQTLLCAGNHIYTIDGHVHFIK